ncbi:UNVERIFIED_CONTAM: hypothetical protein HDU68_004635 [Siphonaria sp. JEL0065]|nr:hypothetical protein HDU68_004635 [Siphonaria sp. JEL0065]
MPLLTTKTTTVKTTTADGKVTTSTTTSKTVTPGPSDEDKTPQVDWTKVTADLDSLRSELGVPGASIGVVHKGKLIFTTGLGRRNDVGETVDADTLFQIGSISKSFTALAYAMLVDDKKIEWNSKVSAIYPVTFPDEVRTKFTTIVDILAHKTGLKHHFITVFIWSEYKELFSRLEHFEPGFELREQFDYNNPMYSLAGAIIDELLKEEGGDWNSFIQKRIFEPLGMKDSLTDLRDLPKAENKSQGYHELDGELTAYPWEYTFWPGGVSKAAGGLCSSANDFAKYVAFILRKGTLEDGTALVTPLSFEKITAAQSVLPMPASPAPSVLKTYGMGWMQGHHRGKHVISHSGGTFGYTCDMWLLPFDDLGVYVFTNSGSGFSRTACSTLIDRVLFPEVEQTFWIERTKGMTAGFKGMQAAEKQAKSDARDKNATASLPLDAYAGTYTSPLFGTLNLTAPVEGETYFKFTLAGKQEYLDQKIGGITGLVGHWQKDTFAIHELIGLDHDRDFEVPLLELQFEIVDNVIVGVSCPMEQEGIVMKFTRG